MKTMDLVYTALFAALICILAPISLPAGEIPVSLATFAIYIAAAVGGWKRGTLAVIVYILIGAAGMPVFAGFSGGVQKLAGVTGGYILGYIPCALIIGYLANLNRIDRRKENGQDADFGSRRLVCRKWILPFSMLIGTLICYTLGTSWFILQTGNDPVAALTMCVVPFLLGDAVKILAASAIVPVLRNALKFSYS